LKKYPKELITNTINTTSSKARITPLTIVPSSIPLSSSSTSTSSSSLQKNRMNQEEGDIKLEKELRFDDLDHIDDDDNNNHNTTTNNIDSSNSNWSNLFQTQNKASKFMIHEKTNDK
jgi:hypothetical protein